MDKQKAIEAARYLKEWCRAQPSNGAGCIFAGADSGCADDGGCRLISCYSPSLWYLNDLEGETL